MVQTLVDYIEGAKDDTKADTGDDAKNLRGQMQGLMQRIFVGRCKG